MQVEILLNSTPGVLLDREYYISFFLVDMKYDSFDGEDECNGDGFVQTSKILHRRPCFSLELNRLAENIFSNDGVGGSNTEAPMICSLKARPLI